MAPQVSGLENEILEPKIKQQSEKEFVAKQSEDQKESDDQKETKKCLSTIDSTDEHLQPQVPLPSPGTPAPGGGIPSSALGDFMRGMAGTWVYANRNEFDADDWF